MAHPKLHKERIFRQTEGVRFSDVSIPNSNGIDLVVHKGFAVSPPNCDHGHKKFYIHYHQTDNNRCIDGARVFELVALNGEFDHDHYLILLDADAGALEIPPQVYHRSVSCSTGSILLNHAVRDEEYSEKKEFNPTAECEDPKMAEVLARNNPIYINATKEEIDCFLSSGSIDQCLVR
jgi:hypothetical protein